MEMTHRISHIHIPVILNAHFLCHGKFDSGDQMIDIAAPKIGICLPGRLQPGNHGIRIGCVDNNGFAARLHVCFHNVFDILHSQRSPDPVSADSPPGDAAIFQSRIGPAGIDNEIRLPCPDAVSDTGNIIQVHPCHYFHFGSVLPPNQGGHPDNVHIRDHLFPIPARHTDFQALIPGGHKIVQQIISHTPQPQNHDSGFPFPQFFLKAV